MKTINLDNFIPREYQLPMLDAVENKGYRRVIAILPRRAGKDVAAWNLMIRQALKRIGIYWYILPTYAQGKKVIYDGMTNDGKKFLDFIPKDLIDGKPNSQEMKIRLINGSIIQIIGSDNVDSLVGANPLGCVFSEYALQDPRAYQLIRPILTANDGWAVFISCVAPSTIIITQDGLRRIKDVSSSRQEYSDLNKSMYGLGGFHNAEQFYYGGKQQTLIIRLENGFEIECTPVHPLWNGTQWVQSQFLKVGDLIPLQYGQDIWGNGFDTSSFISSDHASRIFRFDYSNLTEDFFYLLGLIHADGSYDKNKVCVTKKKDPEIIEFLHSHWFITRKDGIHHELSSREFCEFLEFFGFKHGALNKKFPDSLFSCTKKQMISFLQGVFDGDGTSNSNPSKRGTIKLTSTCKEFLKDVQIILLNFGIVSSITTELKRPTKKVKVGSTIYNIEITGYFAHVFYRDIGFRLLRKQKNHDNVPASVREESGNIYPVNLMNMILPSGLITNRLRVSRRTLAQLHKERPHLGIDTILKEKFFYSPVKEIIESENEVFDFVIPETNSFFSNGFISHNTPRGKNDLWRLWEISKKFTYEWFSYLMTVEETKHINLDDIEKERASGEMSDDLIAQEYWCSFNMGVEGAYYTKYLDRIRLTQQIGRVPWDPALPVHTAWDIGVRDNTSIIFFQSLNNKVHIIDCYSNNKYGLEHYAKIIKDKPYIYGTHIAPHDIKVREFGTGMTRLDKAAELGIPFSVSPHLSLQDGIEAVRTLIPRCFFDEEKCRPLLKALENYRQEWDHKRQVYKSHPLHDNNSHYADSMRYLALSIGFTQGGTSAEELDKRYREAVYGQTGPDIFNTNIDYFY